MKKRIFAMVLAIGLIFGMSTTAFAAGDYPRLVDDADLLTELEEEEVLSTLDQVSESCQMDIAVITIDTISGYTPMEAADDLYDYCGYGVGENHDGMLLLISMAERDWYISTAGAAIDAINDAALSHIEDEMVPVLSEGDYARAFQIYATTAGRIVNQTKSGEVYKEPFPLAQSLGVSLIVGLVAAAIVTGVMRSRLKSVRAQDSAGAYMKEGSMNITRSYDRLLYVHVDRREKPKDQNRSSGTHMSSSGSMHGGGGGKF